MYVCVCVCLFRLGVIYICMYIYTKNILNLRETMGRGFFVFSNNGGKNIGTLKQVFLVDEVVEETVSTEEDYPIVIILYL